MAAHGAAPLAGSIAAWRAADKLRERGNRCRASSPLWRNMLSRALMATGAITVVDVEPFSARAAVIWSDEERSTICRPDRSGS